MRDQLSRAAYQKPIFAEAPVLLIGVGGRRSEPEIGVGHDGTHAVDRDIGAGHAEQSAALIVNGLGDTDQGLGASGVQERLAEISLPGALRSVVPLVRGLVIVLAGGGSAGEGLPGA